MTRELTLADFSESIQKGFKKSDPCWENYEMVGMKDKGGKKVPNCVPKGK
jgi:hypothetical protein